MKIPVGERFPGTGGVWSVQCGRGAIRLELSVSVAERLSLVGRLSGGFDRCAHKPHGGPLPTSPLQPHRYQARSADCPSRPALRRIRFHAPGQAGLPSTRLRPPSGVCLGPWARQHPHRAPPQEGRGFSSASRTEGRPISAPNLFASSQAFLPPFGIQVATANPRSTKSRNSPRTNSCPEF